MRLRIKYLIRLGHTLFDVGFIRLKYRLIYEIKKNIGRILPFEFLRFVIKGFNMVPEINFILEDKYTYKKPEKQISNYDFKEIKFKFINKEVSFNKDFSWNDPALNRLWIFNLHYFDWARKWLDYLIDNNKWNKEANSLIYLIDYWISSNNLKSGYGWHAYTISLRIRNWMWLLQFCPNLFSKNRVRSLWNQLCWLHFNQEKCHGGNHYLENLISLIMVGMLFRGDYAKNIVLDSLTKLEIELNNQILDDGGHEERSASYHNLILDRIVELGCLMEIIQKECPIWLRKYIERMVTWSESTRIINGKMPLFNDSPNDPYYQIDLIINFSRAFLSKKCIDINGLRGNLLTIAFAKNNQSLTYKNILKVNKPLLNLPQTGWIVLRPGDDWELFFKYGKSCPSHLAAHAHSDLLTFDLFHKGKEIICETATSTYWDTDKRNFERSSSAHNTLQMGKNFNTEFKGVEPVDVWSTFRAGKKAKHKCIDFGSINDWLWAQGSHNGFESLGGDHLRWLTIKIGKDKNPILVIIDSISLQKDISIKGYFHLSPIFNKSSEYDSLNFKIFNNQKTSALEYKSYQGYFSEGFGLRSKRKSIKYSINLSKGKHAIFTIFSDNSLKAIKSFNLKNDKLSGEIDFGYIGKIKWDLKANLFYIC